MDWSCIDQDVNWGLINGYWLTLDHGCLCSTHDSKSFGHLAYQLPLSDILKVYVIYYYLKQLANALASWEILNSLSQYCCPVLANGVFRSSLPLTTVYLKLFSSCSVSLAWARNLEKGNNLLLDSLNMQTTNPLQCLVLIICSLTKTCILICTNELALPRFVQSLGFIITSFFLLYIFVLCNHLRCTSVSHSKGKTHVHRNLKKYSICWQGVT